jgi:hypothetical protein
MTVSDEPEAWHVLVCGLRMAGDSFDLGSSLRLRRLANLLTVFDLAATGGVGFREWAILEPLASVATAEMISPTAAVATPGYDALNKCWLASALLVLRGFAGHLCPAVSAYSWNFVAGHQAQTAPIFQKQLLDEGVNEAVFRPHGSLPPFKGGIVDYHLKLLLPREVRDSAFDSEEARWFQEHIEPFNLMAAAEERFRFALEAAVDWRFFKDHRAAIARLWAGIESVFGISSELVYRVSLLASTVLAPRGPLRVESFKRVKQTYGIRSKAVHGEPVPPDLLEKGLKDSYEILRALLLDAVERGKLRNEEDYYGELLM